VEEPLLDLPPLIHVADGEIPIRRRNAGSSVLEHSTCGLGSRLKRCHLLDSCRRPVQWVYNCFWFPCPPTHRKTRKAQITPTRYSTTTSTGFLPSKGYS
ncbi:MAG: hypothetical protein ACFFDE_11905, partial [Promethearchaeota archaeon]